MNNEENHLKKLKKLGSELVKNYSWSKTAKEALEIYKTI